MTGEQLNHLIELKNKFEKVEALVKEMRFELEDFDNSAYNVLPWRWFIDSLDRDKARKLWVDFTSEKEQELHRAQMEYYEALNSFQDMNESEYGETDG